MILVSIILILFAILGAPLFAVIATSAMLGYQRDETDLMNMALEIQSIPVPEVQLQQVQNGDFFHSSGVPARTLSCPL